MYLSIGKQVYLPIKDGLVIRVITVNETFANREKILQSRALGTKIFSSLSLANKYADKLKKEKVKELQNNITESQIEINKILNSDTEYSYV